MTWPEGTLWDRNDRLPVPFDDPAREWLDDNLPLSALPFPVIETEAVERVTDRRAA